MSSDTARAPAKNGAHLMVQALEAEGVDVLFGYPGGAIMPFYDALVGSKLRHILTRHEQGAALAANGFARASGRVGVCVATSGPGASNLVTGIADAFLDSVPMVVLTGQVPTTLMGTDAFQELDVYGMTLPIVKHSFLLRKIEDLPHVVHEAFRIARSGRPGPVLIDFPKDVQIASATHMSLLEPAAADTLPSAPAEGLAEAIAAIASAERPVIYSGQGITLAEAVGPFRQFVEAAKLPTVTTLRGLGNLPPEHPYLIGMGNRTPVRDWIHPGFYVRIHLIEVSIGWPGGSPPQDKPSRVSPQRGRRTPRLAQICDTHVPPRAGCRVSTAT